MAMRWIAALSWRLPWRTSRAFPMVEPDQCYSLPGGEGIDHGDAMEGCMDAVKKYPRRTN